jgi:K+-sensing histidine kinase KdpD
MLRKIKCSPSLLMILGVRLEIFGTMVDMILTAPEDFDDDEQKEMLQLLSQNAQSTYELLENLLNWSTSQRGVITYEPQHLMVNPVIMDIVGFMSPVAANKGN